ncbi:hypothetical protein DSLASN_10620 [Desulfoluna limicola]|uniref:DUF4340 domain-containing protein n=1 Tax=Desulfoluna limicola TaxID=2810562 RepID=A0ABN6F1E3_9BACT|nr:DUF4340 domain-containing protein [Desulfoluna limicola]BCS95430.1 hypothetical protein DSLASN_10620 [Desulfoluna limicola]
MKKEIIILLAVIVALSGYLFTRNTDGTNYTLPELDSIAAEDVDRMEIKKGPETLLLEKRGEDWTVDTEGFPAKKEAVAKLIQAAGDLSLTALVSETESYGRYDLSPDKATRASLFKGDTLLRTVSIGKAAPSRGHTFVTVGDDKNVYHAQGNVNGQFSTDPERFIDKRVFSFNASDVASLTITQGETPLTLTRATETADTSSAPKTAWKDEDGTPLDSETVDTITTALSNLTCDSWLTETPNGTPLALTLTITTDRPYTLNLFGDPPTQGSTPDKELAFTLSDSSSKTIMAAVKSLLGKDDPGQAHAVN